MMSATASGLSLLIYDPRSQVAADPAMEINAHWTKELVELQEVSRIPCEAAVGLRARIEHHGHAVGDPVG